MNIKNLRKMNLIGTILFGLIGSGIIIVILWSIYDFRTNIPKQFGNSLEFSNNIIILLILLLSIYIIFSILFYRYTVIGLDRNEYKLAKRWTLIGAIMGLIIGYIIPFIIFVISYRSFNEVINDQ